MAGKIPKWSFFQILTFSVLVKKQGLPRQKVPAKSGLGLPLPVHVSATGPLVLKRKPGVEKACPPSGYVNPGANLVIHNTRR